MRTILTAALLFLLVAATAESQELAKAKVAVVRFNRLMNNELIGYEELRLLAANKESLEALKKTNAEIKAAQKQIVAAEDDATLNELSRKLEFLNRKSSLLKQRISNDAGGDMQKVVRTFVVNNYKNQYHLIVQEPEALDRFLFKENAEISDITDQVAAKVKEYVANAIGG
jgi:hypothetical protein